MENTLCVFNWESGSRNDNAIQILRQKHISYYINFNGNVYAELCGKYVRLEYLRIHDDTWKIIYNTN